MTDLKKRADYLVSEATRRERAIAATDGRLDDVDTALIARARSVEDAPAEYLPYQAWERSVDVYDPAWPEAIKRAVIAAAPEVHRYKGSVRAVKALLAALQVDATVVEWWQAAPKGVPYTFEVKAYARARLYDGPLLDARLIKVVFASVLRAKPASRAFALTVGANFPAAIGLAPVAAGRTVVPASVAPVPDTRLAAFLGLAPIAVATTAVPASAVPVVDTRLAARLGLAAVALGRVRVAATAAPALPPT